MWDQSALHYAAIAGHINIIQALLEVGANVHQKDEDGFTPLHAVAEFDHLPVITLLLEEGANLNEIDNDGKTPLDLAKDRNQIKSQALLLAYGVTRSIDITSDPCKEAIKLLPDVSFNRRKHALMFRQTSLTAAENSAPIASARSIK